MAMVGAAIRDKIKDVGIIFLLFVCPLLIFLMGYEMGPYLISSLLILGFILMMVCFFIPFIEPKDENNGEVTKEETDIFFFIGFGF
jgi:hypothetical protein